MAESKTKLFGVMGHPIGHSLSPHLHNMLMKELGHEGVYVPFHVLPTKLNEAVKGAHALGINGVNVTIPHKEKVMDYLFDVDPLARQIGAVNTLHYKEEGYVGYNTDADGFLRSLAYEDVAITDKVVVIIGAGGAAKALTILCAAQKAKKIIIMNRNISRAEKLAYLVKQYYDVDIEIYPLQSVVMEESIDLCIQTTPVGMYPNEGAVPVSDESFYKKIKVAVDIIYNPFQTAFLENCKKYGAKTIEGIGMLVYQGIRSYEIWNDIQVPQSIQHKIYLELRNYIQRGSF